MNVGKVVLIGIMVLMMAVSPNLAVAQSRQPAQSYDRDAFGINADFRNFGRDYILPTSHHNFVIGSEEYGHFQSRLDTKLFQTSNRLKEILNRSIHYLNNNESKMNTKEYQNVKNITSRLLRFSRLEMRLRDDGCLNSSDETVRRLARNVLYGSVYSPMPDCAGATGLGSFGAEMTTILRCLNEKGRCTPRAYNNRGLYAVDTLKKREMLGKVWAIKKESDGFTRAAVEFGLGGTCNGPPDLCNQVRENIPNVSGESLRQKADTINRLFERINQGMRQVNLGRNVSAEGQIIAVDQAKSELFQGPLRFAGAEALKKCLPNQFEQFNKSTNEIVNGKGLFGARILPQPLRLIRDSDLSCLKDNTLQQQDNLRNKKNEKFEGQMETLNRLGYIADKTANEMLDDVIVSEPMAFGGYLMRDAPLEQLDSVCETIVMIADKAKRDARFKAWFMTAINIAEAVVIGAAAIVAFAATGPIGASAAVYLGLGAMAISTADGAIYQYLQNGYEKKGAVDDLSSIQFRSRRTPSEEAYQAFTGEMAHRMHLLTEQESARFWKYFAWGGAGLGAAGAGARIAAGGIRELESFGKVGKLIVRGIGRGGPGAKSGADSLITLMRYGEEALEKVELVRRTEAETTKFLQMMAKIREWEAAQQLARGARHAGRAADRFAHTAHQSLHTAEGLTAPVEFTSSVYWAGAYSVDALKAIENLVLLARVEEKLPQQSNYAELERWVRSNAP